MPLPHYSSHSHLSSRSQWPHESKGLLGPQSAEPPSYSNGCADTSRMTVVTELQGLEGSFPPLYGMGIQKEGICGGLDQGLWREMAWVQTLLVAGRH